MGIWDIFKKKETDKQIQAYRFDDIDRDISLKRRRLKSELDAQSFEIEKLKMERARLELQNEIDEYKADIASLNETEDGEEPSSMEGEIIKLFSNVISRGQTGLTSPQQVLNPPSSQNAAVSPVVLSNDQIEQMWEQTPEPQKAIARKATNEQLRVYLANNIHNLSEESTVRCINLIHTK